MIEGNKINEFFNPSLVFDKREVEDFEKRRSKDVNYRAELFIKDPTDKNFEKLMDLLDEQMRRFCKKFVKMDDAVDEVMSRTMENIYFKRDTYNRAAGRFSTWAFRIAFVNCLKYLRNEFGTSISRRVDMDLSDMGELTYKSVSSSYDIEDTDVEHMDMLYENGQFIRFNDEEIFNEIYDSSVESMEHLPERIKTVLKERYLNKKTVTSIAKDNSYPLGTVKRFLMSGLPLLHNEVKNSYPLIYNMYKKSKMAV